MTSQQTLDVPADFVLLMTGYEADMTLCRLAGVQLTEPNQIPAFNPRTMESNIPGIYLAGTVVGGTQEKYRVFIENCHIHVGAHSRGPDRRIAAGRTRAGGKAGELDRGAPDPTSRGAAERRKNLAHGASRGRAASHGTIPD